MHYFRIPQKSLRKTKPQSKHTTNIQLRRLPNTKGTCYHDDTTFGGRGRGHTRGNVVTVITRNLKVKRACWNSKENYLFRIIPHLLPSLLLPPSYTSPLPSLTMKCVTFTHSKKLRPYPSGGTVANSVTMETTWHTVHSQSEATINY